MQRIGTDSEKNSIKSGQKTVDIHVDFGTSDPETVLPALLKRMNDSDLDIKRVVLR